MGSGGTFSLFTQAPVDLILEDGPQEILAKDKMKRNEAEKNMALVIIDKLSELFEVVAFLFLYKLLKRIYYFC
jgi:hypothetical protein